MAPVKPTRAERARQTRRRMIEAARGMFVEQGYAGTTMDQIAAQAQVAVQTVYYTFRTKGQLLTEVVEVTAAGESEPVPVTDRPWAREMMSSTSPQRVLALGVEHGTAIYDRVAALWPAVGAAAAVDPAVDKYWRGVTAARRGGQRAMVARIAELGALRPELSADRATDLVVVLLGHDVYRGLVQDAGWSPAAYRAWLLTTLAQQLLAEK
ncbi:TetR family transcriptional regulator [Lentzea sp. NPDC006480]|uniref:TetR/AcrR family transcriptional regulator n=1 Tax=Lentzea sp. NPDC006480 TaxID=3157176 RepID=UPI00339DFE2B